MGDISMADLLQLVVDEGASDLHIEVGVPPVLRIHGGMHPIDAPPLRPEDTERLMKSITSDDYIQQVRSGGGADFGFAFEQSARFRVSVFRQKGFFGMVLRQIPRMFLTFEEIGLSPMLKELLYKPRGLVLVTGPTGSGKSTTLASMVNIINEERDCHIITLEDPIEYFHDHKKSVVIQREIGVDVPNFAEGLRRALRQDPDIIMVGEMRDLETISLAITASETGHLVFGTLHTASAGRTLDRMLDAFPFEQQAQIRTMVSGSLRGIISQQLVPRADGRGRVLATEVLINTPASANLIREQKTYMLPSVLQTGKKQGMHTMDDCLLELVEKGVILAQEAVLRAENKVPFKKYLEEAEE